MVPWAKLFKRSLISSCGAVFEEIPAGNDMNFSVLVALSAHSVEIVDKVLYIVTVSRGSITTTFSKENLIHVFRHLLDVIDCCESMEWESISNLYCILL